MKVSIIGSGYVGLVTGACLAELGNEVCCLDVDQNKIGLLNGGGVPIYEPGLEELIAKNKKAGRIRFTSDIEEAVSHGVVQFIAVGTPSDEDGSADLKYVLAAARNIGRYMTEFKVIVDKSTVPVGTAERVSEVILEELNSRNISVDYSVVSNPEFLKEGAAIDDFMRPDRIVIGTSFDASGQKSKEIMRKLYAPFNRHHERTFYMDVKSAELTKYAANAMLATRISFMNELANLADMVGADVEHVRHGIGSDSRIGYGFLYAGTGYGGSCFPKDVQALIKTANENGETLKILQAVEDVNQRQKTVLVKKIMTHFGEDLTGKRFAIWGLSFKPNTDDMREAPSRLIIKELLARGASGVQLYDPVAMSEAKPLIKADLFNLPEAFKKVKFVDEFEMALDDADALVIVTEWKIFKSPNFDVIKHKLNSPVIFDGRNLYDPEEMKLLGINYYGIGRANI